LNPTSGGYISAKSYQAAGWTATNYSRDSAGDGYLLLSIDEQCENFPFSA